MAPHNVWLTSQDSKYKAKLGDFDSAIDLDQNPEHRPVTSDGFASPEELRGGHLDRRSDLYSLGGVLISLARARLSFDEPEKLRELRPDFPPALTSLLADLVADDPDGRPDSAEEVLGRLRNIDDSLDLYAVIAAGEGPTVEFKASMRFPRGADEPWSSMAAEVREKLYARLQKSVLKSIAALLNSHGGTLLIGVEDDGHIIGIDDDFQTLSDTFGKDRDGWQLNLKDQVKRYLDADVWAILHLTIHHIDTVTVARIDCPARTHPTWLTPKGQPPEFYVRAFAASEPLPAPEWSQYINERWLS